MGFESLPRSSIGYVPGPGQRIAEGRILERVVKETDRARLVSFLGEVEQALDWIVNEIDLLAPSPAADSTVKEALKKAWAEVGSTKAVVEAQEKIRSGGADAILEEHGLTGDQLDFKLRAFGAHRDRFESMKDSVGGAGPSSPRRRYTRLLSGLLRSRARDTASS